MTRHPQTVVDRIEQLLNDDCMPDEIAVLLRMDEDEVRRIALLLAERGPAEPAPDVDVAALVQAADDVLTVDVDEQPAITAEHVKAAAVVVRRATSGTDLDDLAGALGIRHAVEPAERWLNARARAAAEPSAEVENHKPSLVEAALLVGAPHVHDPFVAWRENGVPYAVCTCGQTWERQTCTVCPAPVAALWVAQHGPTHKHCAEKKG